jgi:MscS family membrane protein
VALAAKETLSNFFGGVTVLLDQPYRVGDYIILDSGERGEVAEIGLRSTRILTRDDVQISIPNSIITNTKVINESAPEPRFRVRIKVGVAYGTDVDQVEEVLLTVARDNALVVPEPEPRVRFRTFGDSSLDFELLCWAHRPHDKGRIIHQLNRATYKAFEQAGIVIPFPQRDVHMHSPSEGG